MFKILVAIIGLIFAEENFEYDFTAIAGDSEYVYVGAKKSSSGVNPSHKLVKIKINDYSNSNLEISEIAGRDIVGLFNQDKKLYIVSQATQEMGDQPQLHELNLVTNRWTNLGKADCKAILGLEVAKGKMTFTCEKIDDNGKALKYKTYIENKLILLSSVKYFALPQKEFKLNALNATLIQENYNTTKLKLGNNKSSKELKVQDLF